MQKIKIEMVSDVACPWCFVGKRNLEKAIETFGKDRVEVSIKPFQLDPYIPMEGIDRKDYFDNKFGGEAATERAYSQVANAGKNSGINFDFYAASKVINTINLHKFLYLAKGEEKFEIKEAFFSAMFEKGIDLSNVSELLNVLEPFGYEITEIERVISDKNLEKMVRLEIQNYQQKGISSVPFFILNDKYGLSGAQPTENFLMAFEQISQV
jgi:predicted DsbA family dithiol-disulfide isomerase